MAGPTYNYCSHKGCTVYVKPPQEFCVKHAEIQHTPYYQQLYLSKAGEFQLRYSRSPRGPWIMLFRITADQADWMHADGWPIVKEE